MDFSNLKSMLDRNVDKYYPGLDISVHKEGKEIFRYQTGYSNSETKTPIDPDALYYVFSCTKPGTCVGAMQLLEKGYFCLNDPVYDFIPEFKDVVVMNRKSNGAVEYEKPKSPITVGHLFSMTSGINYNLNMPSIQEVRERTKGRMPTLEVVKAIAKNPLQFHPGEHYTYGLNHDVLGGLIEVWSGMKFGEYMQKNVYGACGMESTGFKVTPEVKSRVQWMTGKDENGEFIFKESTCEYMLGEDSEYESGGAGLITCVKDYVELASALANGGVSPKTGERILNQHTIDVMRTNRLTETQIAELGPKGRNGYGYGLGVRTLMTNSCGCLENIGTFGWDGAAGCYIAADPTENIAVFMARNVRPPANDIVSVLMMNSLYTDLHK